MYDAALIPGLRQDFRYRFDKSQAFVANHKADSMKTSLFQMAQKTLPALPVFSSAFFCSNDLAVPFTVYSQRNEDGYVLDRTAPVFLQVDPVDIDVRILVCQFPVSPFLDLGVHFFVQIADCPRRHPRAPQRF